MIKFGEDGLREYPGYVCVGYKIWIVDQNGARPAWTEVLAEGQIPTEAYFDKIAE